MSFKVICLYPEKCRLDLDKYFIIKLGLVNYKDNSYECALPS